MRDDDQKPIAGAEIWLGPLENGFVQPFESYDKPENSVTSDANGEFTMRDVATGSFRIGVAPKSRSVVVNGELVAFVADDRILKLTAHTLEDEMIARRLPMDFLQGHLIHA